MNADGSGQRRLTSTGAGGHFLRWTKDGRGVVFRAETRDRAPDHARRPRRRRARRRCRRCRAAPTCPGRPTSRSLMDVRGHGLSGPIPWTGPRRGGYSSSRMQTCGSTIRSGRPTAGGCCSTAPSRTAATSGCSTGSSEGAATCRSRACEGDQDSLSWCLMDPSEPSAVPTPRRRVPRPAFDRTLRSDRHGHHRSGDRVPALAAHPEVAARVAPGRAGRHVRHRARPSTSRSRTPRRCPGPG